MHAHVRINQRQIRIINRGKHGHFIFLLICPKIFRMIYFFGTEGVFLKRGPCLLFPFNCLPNDNHGLAQCNRSHNKSVYAQVLNAIPAAPVAELAKN